MTRMLRKRGFTRIFVVAPQRQSWNTETTDTADTTDKRNKKYLAKTQGAKIELFKPLRLCAFASLRDTLVSLLPPINLRLIFGGIGGVGFIGVPNMSQYIICINPRLRSIRVIRVPSSTRKIPKFAP